MSTFKFPQYDPRIIPGNEVTDEQLARCAQLFSENYGVWGPSVPAPLKAGNRVRMSVKVLREQCMSDPENSVLSMMYKDGRLVGHAFAMKWKSGTETVGWITQLVVELSQRQQGIATRLLQGLTTHPWFADVTMMGVASSHPAACNSLCNMSGQQIARIDLSYIREKAPIALRDTTVQYLKAAQLGGSLFGDVDDGSISLVDTGFHVDHCEPQQVLNSYVEKDKWRLGTLKEGHEFLLLLPTA